MSTEKQMWVNEMAAKVKFRKSEVDYIYAVNVFVCSRPQIQKNFTEKKLINTITSAGTKAYNFKK